jgi:hypothetical protein
LQKPLLPLILPQHHWAGLANAFKRLPFTNNTYGSKAGKQPVLQMQTKLPDYLRTALFWTEIP